jgi:hypothetical protein
VYQQIKYEIEKGKKKKKNYMNQLHQIEIFSVFGKSLSESLEINFYSKLGRKQQLMIFKFQKYY